MAMDSAEAWRKCFEQWPAELARHGVLVTSFNEQIPFASFSTSSELLLVERRAPDTVGARMVIVPYGSITGLKIVDILKPKAFSSLGFASPSSNK